MDNNQGNGQNRKPVRPNIQGQQPVRPQMNNQSQPVRPNIQGQKPVRPQINGQQPVRPNIQGQQPVRPQMNGQQPVRTNMQRPQENGQIQGQQINSQEQYVDNSFEEFNSTMVDDTVAKNREQGKKQKKVKEKKVLTPEQKKKQFIIAGAIIGGLLLLAIIIIVVSNLMKGSSKHITVADPSNYNNTQTEQVEQQEPVVEQPEQIEQETQNTEDNQEVEQTQTVEKIVARENSENSPLDLNEYSSLKLVVNTKTAEDSNYVDRDAEVYVRLSNMISGYEAASEYIKDYNDKNVYNKLINLPSMKEYYSRSNGTEMVMLEFEMVYTSDFPTSASEGVVYRIPTASLDIFGTLEEIDSDDIDKDPSNYIVVDDTIYDLPKLTDISVYEVNESKGIKVGEPIYFRYILALPVGASSEVYGFKLNLALDVEDMEKDTGEFWFKGQEIKASSELEQFLESQAQIEEESSEENANTEDGEAQEQVDTEDNN